MQLLKGVTVRQLLPLLLLFSGWAGANTNINSGCSVTETSILSNPAFLARIGGAGKLIAADCATGPKDHLYAALVINVASGIESYLVVIERKGMTVQSKPLLVSPAMGFDAFPILLNGQKRLLFVKPEKSTKSAAVYVNVQTGPNATHLVRWDLDLETNKATENQQRQWMLSAGKLPKIYLEKEEWRAMMGNRSVAL